MNDAVLAIDAGTTNVRSLLVGADGRALASSVTRVRRNHPAPGLVEQDPEEIWSAVESTIAQAVKKAGIGMRDIAAVGITGQRSTAIVWERATGKPAYPAVGWQDQRGKERSAELVAQGFITAWPTTPAAKLEQILRAIPDGFKRMRRGELAWGNVDSFIAWRLSGGALHVTDYTNASGTGYFQYLDEWDWRDALLEAQGLDRSFFPQVVDTAGRIGLTSRRLFGKEVPIGAIIGDQQSATYAQGCLKPGQGKITFGTSATCDVNSGTELKLGAGSYPTVLWRRGDSYNYCLEGMVFTAGAVFDWLTGLGFIEHPSAAAAVAGGVEDSHGVFFLPSLQGLGTPHVDPERRAFFGGLTLGATAAHFVRAAVEGVAFRVREMVDQIYQDSDLPLPELMRVDGGAAANDVFMQLLADVLGRPVDRMQPLEATAYGAAFLAGESCGLWEPWSIVHSRRSDRVFEPAWSEDQREERFQQWKRACQL
jgi:glycerol kinase